METKLNWKLNLKTKEKHKTIIILMCPEIRYWPICLSLLTFHVRGPSWIILLVDKSRFCERRKSLCLTWFCSFHHIMSKANKEEKESPEKKLSTTLNWGAASSLRWYWLRRCRCSVSLTTSLTACSIPRQHAWARWSEGRSDVPAEWENKETTS